jgi:DNA-binding FrmR family transcriptional regulator
MSHTQNSKSKLLGRIRRIKGQSVAIEASLEGNPECMALLQQIAALKGAVNGLMKEVLEEHIREQFRGRRHYPTTTTTRDRRCVIYPKNLPKVKR